MGHYASEMDPNWGKEDERVTRLRKKGFRIVSTSDLISAGCPLDKLIGCEQCGTLVFDTAKHRKTCKADTQSAQKIVTSQKALNSRALTGASKNVFHPSA